MVHSRTLSLPNPMTRPQYLFLLICALLSFALGATLLTFHFMNQRAEVDLVAEQAKLAGFQEELNRGEISRRLTLSIAQDLSAFASQKPEIQHLFARYGITLNKNAPAP